MNSSTQPYPTKAPVTRLGDYELLEQLGEGGMGVVFKAQQVSLDRLVALKVMKSDAVPRGYEAMAKKRFMNEARAMARLDHPNILPIHEVDEVQGVSFFSMKLVPEGSLSQQMDHFTRNLKAAAALVGQVAAALDHAHR